MNIFRSTKTKDSVERLETSVQHLREQVFLELDEHREAINADNTELCVHSDRLDELERKIDILCGRVEKLTKVQTTTTPHNAPLTFEEQQVFLAIYTEEQENWLSVRDVALKAGVHLHAVPSIIDSMLYKNIPLEQTVISGECHIQLDDTFRHQQAKHNIISISEVAKTHMSARHHVTLDRFSS